MNRMGGNDEEVIHRLVGMIGKSWWPNDGCVNTISENGPKIASNNMIENFDPNDIEKGVWNEVPVIKEWTTINLSLRQVQSVF